MKSSQIVMRRFTTPNCTLEIAGTESALSRWMGTTTLKHLTFRLWLINPEHPDVREPILQGDQAQLDALQEAVEAYVQALLIDEPRLLAPLTTLESAFPPASTTSPLRLQPVGKLSHELIPDNLAASEPQPPIRLSLVELSDLTTVLDRYATELRALPVESQRRSNLIPWPWQQVAVALVTVGVVGLTARLLLPNVTLLQTASAPQAERDALQSQTAAPAAPTAPTPPAKTTASNLASAPAIGLNLDGQLNRPTPSPTVPASLFPTPTTKPEAKPGSGPAPNQLGSAPTQIALNPGPQTTVVPPSVLNLPPLKESQRVESRSTARSDTTPMPSIARSAPTQQQTSAAEQFYRRSQPGETTGTTLKAPPATAAAPMGATQMDATQSSNRATTSNNSTAFDVVPQVAEARQYLQQRWQPPSGLTRTLEYSAVIGTDGTLQRVIPLNQAAMNYINQTGIPMPGQVWLSPLPTTNPLTLRLVLSPDGKVQTFQE